MTLVRPEIRRVIEKLRRCQHREKFQRRRGGEGVERSKAMAAAWNRAQPGQRSRKKAIDVPEALTGSLAPAPCGCSSTVRRREERPLPSEVLKPDAAGRLLS